MKYLCPICRCQCNAPAYDIRLTPNSTLCDQCYVEVVVNKVQTPFPWKRRAQGVVFRAKAIVARSFQRGAIEYPASAITHAPSPTNPYTAEGTHDMVRRLRERNYQPLPSGKYATILTPQDVSKLSKDEIEALREVVDIMLTTEMKWSSSWKWITNSRNT